MGGPVTAERHGHCGFVYFAEADKGRVVKIGHAMTPGSRLVALGKVALVIYGDPGVRYLGVIKGDWKDERAMHRRFASALIGHEWFRLTEEIRNHVESLRPHFVDAELWTASGSRVREIMTPPDPPKPFTFELSWDGRVRFLWSEHLGRYVDFCPLELAPRLLALPGDPYAAPLDRPVGE